jgi:hypothetical protein
MADLMEQTDWTPERKIFAAALAGLVTWAVQALGVELPIGAEASVAVVVGYLIPSRGN